MKIGLSTSVMARGQSGVGQYVLALVRALQSAARRHDLTLFVLEQLVRELEKLPDAELTGPAPAPISRIGERYRFQVFLRTKRILALTPKLRPLVMERAWPDDVQVTVDVDPVSLL